MIRIPRALVGLFTIAAITPAFAQDTLNFPVLGTVHRYDDAVDRLLPSDAKLEVIASGFDWTEGPVWIHDEDGGYLLFSDIPRNSIMKWKEGVGVSLYMKPAGYTGVADYGGEPGSNGLLLDPQGRLICCEHGDRRLSVVTKDGGKRTLVDSYKALRLNSPNDACFMSNGDLYFTDPPYGLPNRWEDPLRELDFCGVYRLDRAAIALPATGPAAESADTDAARPKVTLLTEEMTRPNGIAFSPDEKFLYVAQSDPEAAIWKKFPVKKDGTLGAGELFYDATENVGKLPGLPDGLKVDSHGNLFATGPGGVYIFSPDAKLIGRIETGERTSNCAWGDDGTTLYITADMYLCRIQTSTKGAGWK